MTTGLVPALRAHASSLLAVATGALLLRLAWTGAHTSYVKPSTGWLLVLAGIVLVVAGGSALVVAAGHQHAADEHDGPATAPRVAGLMVLPLALLVLVSPPALGAYYAQHAASSAPVTARPGDATLLPSGPAVALSLGAAARRAVLGTTLEGRRLRLLGFVAGVEPDGQVQLARFSVKCCAADAVPRVITVTLPPGAAVPADGTWLDVVVTWQGPGQDAARFVAESAQTVDEPDDPYEG